MKNSQKGMKLNEARYFRQPRPYTRKRITKMRLIPDSSGLNGSVNSSPKDRLPLSSYPRSSERSRDRCITLDRDQRSREIAWISYTSDSEDNDDFYLTQGHCRDRWRDRFVETDPEMEIVVSLPEAVVSLSRAPEVEKLQIKQEEEKEVQVELEIQAQESKVEKEKDVEDSKPEVPVKPEVAEESKEATNKEDRHKKSESQSNKNSSSDSERSIWWRYGSIRKILDFFGHLLGKRASDEHDEKSQKIGQVTQLVETSVERSPNAEKNKKVASPIKSRTKRSSKRKTVATRKNVATKQPDDLIASGLTRQIMNTRDKKLRATLLEHEMRARKLEEENRRYRRIFEDKLKTRQMSSPLH